jgi:uncharacterized repeat protein (TIGR03803 family)
MKLITMKLRTVKLTTVTLRTISIFLFCIATLSAASAQTFHLLHSFKGNDGANPYAGLVQATDGNLYGTTIDGGLNGGGNVFKITLGGKVTSIYDFCSAPNCTDGQYPVTVLVQGTDGNFYGTTQSGGTEGGFGTVFKITPAGTLTTLHSFSGYDGAAPYGSLVLAANGNFYGTTNVGTANGSGSVFTITPSGGLTTLYNFCSKIGCSDGQYPVGPLIQGSDGDIYGATNAGGDYKACTVDGCGTVYKINLSGKLTTLHTFSVTDGDYPKTGLIEGANGMFYGTTSSGGVNDDGTVFTIDASGAFNSLYSFSGSDGLNPSAMLLASDGNFYGTTLYGGTNYIRGSVFEITPDGALTNLHTFTGRDGKNPYGLVQDTNGKFYGVSYFGGVANGSDGVVFNVSNGLAPFVQTNPASGNIGVAVSILGTGLKGATAVSFNGTPALFTVVSTNEIVATVPAGAKSGWVTVTTRENVTLKSNVEFRVTK